MLNLEDDYARDSYTDTDFRAENRYPYHAAVMIRENRSDTESDLSLLTELHIIE